MYDKRLTIGQLGHRFRCQECRQKPLEIDLLSSIDPYAADRPDEQAVVVLSGMFLEHIQLIERYPALAKLVFSDHLRLQFPSLQASSETFTRATWPACLLFLLAPGRMDRCQNR
jgi:hypothetical protein